MTPANSIQITTLVENTATKRGLLGEWGLCLFIEADGRKILLDTGASPHAVAHNAAVMGIDLSAVDALVLSHGHYDHTGGLTAVLQAAGRPMEVIAHPAVWDLKYSKRKDPSAPSYCGIPYTREELERLGAQFTLTAEPTWITERIVVSGEEPMTTGFEVPDPVLCIKRGGGYIPDPVADDQSLYVKTDRGLVVVAGCAHRGIVNVVRHGCDLTGMDTIHLVVGGTHLHSAAEEQIGKTIDAFKTLGVQWVGVSHCTGQGASARLAEAFGDRFFYNNTGTVIPFPIGPGRGGPR